MTIRIALLPGDGIGPEVLAQVLPLLSWLRSRGRPLAWEHFPHGAGHFLDTGETLSQAAFETIRDGFDAVLFGAVGDPRVPDNRHAEEILLRLRRELELSVNLRPCAPLLDRFVPLRRVSASALNIEVFRENTEGPYCLQGETREDQAIDMAVHTPRAVARLLRAAFLRSAERGCRITLAHKANVLKHGHGLWTQIFRTLAAEHPEVSAEMLHADALLCRLLQEPTRFGVIAADNYLGDLISDLLAAFQGGMGMAASLNHAPHRPYRCSALAEPVHGSAPDLAGRDLANPCGMFLATALLLEHFGWHPEATRLREAIASVLGAGEGTPDLGGDLSCSDLGARIRRRLLD